jgi:hypothetical protein
MAIDNLAQAQIDLLKAILIEIKTTRNLLEKMVKIDLKESKQNLKEAREQRKRMLLEYKRILETPNKDAMILEELKKRGFKG